MQSCDLPFLKKNYEVIAFLHSRKLNAEIKNNMLTAHPKPEIGGLDDAPSDSEIIQTDEEENNIDKTGHISTATQSEKNICVFCHKENKTARSLKRHYCTHSYDRLFRCESTFKTKQHLQEHSVVHSGEKRHRCNI